MTNAAAAVQPTHLTPNSGSEILTPRVGNGGQGRIQPYAEACEKFVTTARLRLRFPLDATASKICDMIMELHRKELRQSNKRWTPFESKPIFGEPFRMLDVHPSRKTKDGQPCIAMKVQHLTRSTVHTVCDIPIKDFTLSAS